MCVAGNETTKEFRPALKVHRRLSHWKGFPIKFSRVVAFGIGSQRQLYILEWMVEQTLDDPLSICSHNCRIRPLKERKAHQLRAPTGLYHVSNDENTVGVSPTLEVLGPFCKRSDCFL
jgi:hypothetical protein